MSQKKELQPTPDNFATASSLLSGGIGQLHRNPQIEAAERTIREYYQARARHPDEGYTVSNGNHWRAVFEAAEDYRRTHMLTPEADREIAEGLHRLMMPFHYDETAWQERGEVLFSDDNIRLKNRLSPQEKRRKGQNASDERIAVKMYIIHYVE